MSYSIESNENFSGSSQNQAKHCWVCFANEDDDLSAQWVSPCKCKGTAKWIHKACLQRWIDEKQQGNSSVDVTCPQCNTAYIILYPKSGFFVRVLDTFDRIICKSCPFLAGGILVGSVYWTAVTYGAVTIMQVLGHKEGLNVMEKADPLMMLIGLPTIPVMLMLGRLVRWEDAVLKFWRKHSTKLPFMNMIFPSSNSSYMPRVPAVAYTSNSDPVSFTRTICGGLILPTIATIFGKLLFQRVKSNFQRSIIGGIAFIGLKGIFKIYYKQQQYMRQAHRQIKNYESCNASSALVNSTSNNVQPSISNYSPRRPRQNSNSTSQTNSQSSTVINQLNPSLDQFNVGNNESSIANQDGTSYRFDLNRQLSNIGASSESILDDEISNCPSNLQIKKTRNESSSSTSSTNLTSENYFNSQPNN